MDLGEFKAKIKKKNAFLKRVLTGGKIFIKGDEDVLSKIIERNNSMRGKPNSRRGH